MVNTEVRKIFLAVFSIFGTVIFLLAMSCNAFADDITPVAASSKFSVDVNNAVLELTIPSAPAVIDLNPTMTGASFGSTSIDIKVATNNITGYTLTMTPTNLQTDTSLIRTELIVDEEEYREIETLELTDPISTGYTEQSFTTNKWGYKITGDNYYGIDPENTTVSHPAWATDAPTNETHHNLTLAAKVDAETTAGSYETTLNFRAVTNAVVAKHTLSFNANGGTGTMEGIVVTAGDTVQLPLRTFTPPEGYRFSGWATTQTGLGTGVRYFDDGAEYTAIDNGINQSVILYAQWTLSTTPSSPTPAGVTGTTFQRAYEIAYTAMKKGMYELTGPGSTHYEVVDSWNETNPEQYKNLDVRFAMQDMTPDICASVTAMHDDYQALDVRDDKLYHITKLQDGNCWMTQNLDYNITGPVTSEYSDINETNNEGYSTNNGYSVNNSIISWTPTKLTTLPSEISSSGTATWEWNSAYGYSLDPGNWYNDGEDPGARYNYLAGTTGDHFRKDEPYNSNGTHGHVGNYYTYATAIATNDVTYWLNDNDYYDSAYAPQNSICPKGWSLPLENNVDHAYMNLITTYELNNPNHYSWIRLEPLYFIEGGVFLGSLDLAGIWGVYLGSVMRYPPPDALGIEFNASNLRTTVGNYDGYGHEIGRSVRCLAR